MSQSRNCFSSKNGRRNWEYLPQICLLLVLEKINLPVSLVQFGAVSRYWHSVFTIYLGIRRQSSTNLVPMLLIPSKDSATNRELYSLRSKSKVSKIELPKPYPWRFSGSCYGWLATVDENLVITLLNPFNNDISIDLPRLDMAHVDADDQDNHDKIQKVVLSDEPNWSSSGYVVAVIHGFEGRLAIQKSGRKDWIYVDEEHTRFSDILFHKNWVYAVTNSDDYLVQLDIHSDDGKPRVNKLERNAWSYLYSYQAYLVKSSMGNIYSILKEVDSDDDDDDHAHSTKGFRVFKLVLEHENGGLVEKRELGSIDGDVVFVGDNKTLAVSALDFPQGRPNSIYFTDDYIPGNDLYDTFGAPEIGIFHLNDKSFGEYYEEYNQPSHKDLAPCIWISSPFQCNSTLLG